MVHILRNYCSSIYLIISIVSETMFRHKINSGVGGSSNGGVQQVKIDPVSVSQDSMTVKNLNNNNNNNNSNSFLLIIL